MNVKHSARTASTTTETNEAQSPCSLIPQFRLHRILVPTDFSECSKKALCYAPSLSKHFGAEILLLHVVEPVPEPSEMIVTESGLLTARMHEETTKHLAQWQSNLAKEASTKAALRAGSAHREIVQAAVESNVDLIVLGTHGRTGLAHFLIGSTAERVVRHAPCPVLVVRERERDFVAVVEGKTLRAERTKKGKDYYGSRTKEKRSRKSGTVLHR